MSIYGKCVNTKSDRNMCLDYRLFTIKSSAIFQPLIHFVIDGSC